MSAQKKITLSVRELLAALAYIGEKQMAIAIAKGNGTEKNEIKDSEEILRNSDWWDEQSPNKLDDRVSAILNQMIKAPRSVRFENGEDMMNIYAANPSSVLVEYIHNGFHTFSHHPHSEGYRLLTARFYGLDPEMDADPAKINIDIGSNWYDRLHDMSSEELLAMINDEKNDPKIREFLKAFNANGQKVFPITFLQHNELDFAIMMIPADSYVWNVDYENANNEQIILTSSTSKDYFKAAEDMLKGYLESAPSVKPKRKVRHPDQPKEGKGFSLKRGWPFFWKGNLLLLLMIAVFFINKGSWDYEGGGAVSFFWLQWEIAIIFLSIVACLRPKPL